MKQNFIVLTENSLKQDTSIHKRYRSEKAQKQLSKCGLPFRPAQYFDLLVGPLQKINLSSKIRIEQIVFSGHGDIKRDEIYRIDNKCNAKKRWKTSVVRK